jgi:hypothetical protein
VDLIYTTFVLQHVPKTSLDYYFSEFSRLLTTEGLLIFQYPVRPRWTLPGIGFKVLPAAVMNAGQRYLAGFPEAMPMNWMSSRKMAQKVATSGFPTCRDVFGLKYSPNWLDAWYLCKK